jgi:hypothetical protein
MTMLSRRKGKDRMNTTIITLYSNDPAGKR